MAMKNVLHLIDTDFISGPGKTIYNSWRFSNPQRYNILIAVFSSGQNKYIDFLNENNAPVIEIKERVLGLPYQLSYFFNIYSIRKILWKYKIDILHTHHHKSDFFGLMASAFSNIKLISTHHGFIENSDKAVWANKIARWSTEKMSAIVAVSDKMVHHLIEFGLPRNKIHMIHNAIVVDDYPVLPKSEKIINEFNLQNKFPIIGCIGRISPEKGQKVLCEAFTKIKKKYSNAVLLLIGNGEGSEELKKEYQALDSQIIFTGHRKNVKDLISVMDIHALPSFTEGLPNVVLETSLMGVPNVATAVGGTPECIVDGETGFLVESGNANAIYQKTDGLLSDSKKLEKMKTEARNFTLNEYDFNYRMKKMFGLYDSIISNGNQ